MARAPLCQPVELLRRAAIEICRGRLQMLGSRSAWWYAGAAALGRTGGRNRSCLAGGHRGAGRGRMPRRPHLRERDQARRALHFRHLALRF